MQFTNPTTLLLLSLTTTLTTATPNPNPDLINDIGNSIAAAGSQGINAASSAANAAGGAITSAGGQALSAASTAGTAAIAQASSAGNHALSAASTAATGGAAAVTSAFASVPAQYTSLVNQGMAKCSQDSSCSAWAATASRVVAPKSSNPAVGVLAGVAGVAAMVL